VEVVTGDTKVVQHGAADGIFINTAGIGLIPEGISISSSFAEEGDAVIINGTVGDHGLAILSLREGIDFGSGLESDAAALNGIISSLTAAFRGIRCMRDATRGGIAAVLNEIAADSGVGIHIEEELIPVSESVRAGCELMGYDPLHIANEGKFIMIADGGEAEDIVERMRENPLGREARIIGRVGSAPEGRVVMKTGIGGERVVDFPYGDILPRIC
jgi:hydrogenase expression/formation protein HypE